MQFVLEGSVSGPKERMKIRARLSDALSGKVVWSERWDGQKSEDVFGLLEKIAEQVLVAVGEGAKAALSAYEYLLPRL